MNRYSDQLIFDRRTTGEQNRRTTGEQNRRTTGDNNNPSIMRQQMNDRQRQVNKTGERQAKIKLQFTLHKS